MSEETKTLRETIGPEKIKNGKLKEILRERINKIEFKEIKDSILGVLYMVCEFSNEGELLARGVSIRSLLDGFSRKKGKNKAFGRAVKALLSKTSTEPIREFIPEDTIISRSLTCKDDSTKEAFKRLLPYLESSNKRGEKIFYKVCSFLPLEIVSWSIDFKSEFKPTPVEFWERIDES